MTSSSESLLNHRRHRSKIVLEKWFEAENEFDFQTLISDPETHVAVWDGFAEIVNEQGVPRGIELLAHFKKLGSELFLKRQRQLHTSDYWQHLRAIAKDESSNTSFGILSDSRFEQHYDDGLTDEECENMIPVRLRKTYRAVELFVSNWTNPVIDMTNIRTWNQFGDRCHVLSERATENANRTHREWTLLVFRQHVLNNLLEKAKMIGSVEYGNNEHLKSVDLFNWPNMELTDMLTNPRKRRDQIRDYKERNDLKWPEMFDIFEALCQQVGVKCPYEDHDSMSRSFDNMDRTDRKNTN